MLTKIEDVIIKNKLSPSDFLHTATFSPDGEYLAVGVNQKPFLAIYKLEKSDPLIFDRFIVNIDELPPSPVFSVSFSKDSKYLAVGYGEKPYLSVYERNGDTFTKLPDLASHPHGAVRSVAFYETTNELFLVALYHGSKLRFYSCNLRDNSQEGSSIFSYYGEGNILSRSLFDYIHSDVSLPQTVKADEVALERDLARFALAKFADFINSELRDAGIFDKEVKPFESGIPQDMRPAVETIINTYKNKIWDLQAKNAELNSLVKFLQDKVNDLYNEINDLECQLENISKEHR